MSKLPNIFHSDCIIFSINKKSFNSFYKYRFKEEKSTIKFDKDILINYFNKFVVIELNNGNKSSGILISKRNDKILLNTGESININDIVSIK